VHESRSRCLDLDPFDLGNGEDEGQCALSCLWMEKRWGGTLANLQHERRLSLLSRPGEILPMKRGAVASFAEVRYV